MNKIELTEEELRDLIEQARRQKVEGAFVRFVFEPEELVEMAKREAGDE